MEPIPAELLYDFVSLRELAVSPDGQRIAFIASEWNRAGDAVRSSLYSVPADGDERPHRIARASDVRSPRWSPDGSQLAVLAERGEDLGRLVEATDDEREMARESPECQVWAFDMTRGGDARQVTNRGYGVREFDWGPEGDRLVVSARDPTETQQTYLERREEGGPIEIEHLQHVVDGVGYTDDVTTYLFIVDGETGEERRLDRAFGEGTMVRTRGLHPTWNPSTDEIAFLTNPDDHPEDSLVSDLFVVDAERGDVSRVTDERSILVGPEWSPDGNWVTVSGRDATNWYAPADVYVVDPATGTCRTLTDDLDATVTWFELPQFANNASVVGGFGEGGWSRPYALPIDGGAPRPLDVGLGQNESLRHFDVAGGRLAFSISDPETGHDLHVGELECGEIENVVATPVTDLNRDIVDEYPMPGFRRLETSNGSITIESMCYYPESFDPTSPEPHPLILWSHGGPFDYEDPEFNLHVVYFTSRGYLVCKPNFRGSTSYGRTFADTLRGRWGTAEVDDLLAVLDDLVERGWAARDRLFPMGFSYGAIATGFLITRSNRFAAAVAEHGVYDLRSDFGTSEFHAWMSVEFGLPWEHPDRFDAGSSITDVEHVETPTLITAGGQDRVCPVSQSEQFYVSLKKQDVPAKLVIYPEEDHTTRIPSNTVHRLEEIATWFETHDPTTEST